jgi:hypothetical protein
VILVTIATGARLAPAPAASYARMCAGYGAVIPVTVAYRDGAAQRVLYEGWLAHLPGFAFALPPGQSVHELGYAIDFGPGARAWLEVHAGAYGWICTNPGEWWHREYQIQVDTHLTDTMDATQAQQLRETRDAVGRLEQLLNTTNGALWGALVQTRQAAIDAAGGIAGFPALLAADDAGAIAAELAAALPADIAAQVAAHLVVSVSATP